MVYFRKPGRCCLAALQAGERAVACAIRYPIARLLDDLDVPLRSPGVLPLVKASAVGCCRSPDSRPWRGGDSDVAALYFIPRRGAWPGGGRV